jgi:hypothetical protein
VEAPQAEPADAEQRGVAMVLAEAADTPPPGPHNAIDALSKGAIHVASEVTPAGAHPDAKPVTISVDDITPLGGDGANTTNTADAVMPGQRIVDATGGSRGNADDLDGTVTVAQGVEPASGEAPPPTAEVSDAALMNALDERIIKMANNDLLYQAALASGNRNNILDARREAGVFATMTVYDDFVRENPDAAARLATKNDAMRRALDRKAEADAKRAQGVEENGYGGAGDQSDVVDTTAAAGVEASSPAVNPDAAAVIAPAPEAKAEPVLTPEQQKAQEQWNKNCYDNITTDSRSGPGIPITADSKVDDVLAQLAEKRKWDPNSKDARANVESAIAHAKSVEAAAKAAEAAKEAEAKKQAAEAEKSGMMTPEQVKQLVAKNTETMRAEMKADREKVAEMMKQMMEAINNKDKREEIFKKILAFLVGFVSGAIITTTEGVKDIATSPEQHAR